jgi:hypothetical protein
MLKENMLKHNAWLKDMRMTEILTTVFIISSNKDHDNVSILKSNVNVSAVFMLLSFSM